MAPEDSDGIEHSPHNFSEFREAKRTPSLIFGAGLSAGAVPFPYQILQEVKQSAEAELKCGAIEDLPEGNTALYVWAERVLTRIRQSGDVPAKLLLARALGLLSDPRWAADVDFEGAADRHRVIARFAREELWGTIWSLNWDCLLESALESVGFERGEASRDQPWLTMYSSVIFEGDFVKLGRRDLICVSKPHGCVRALRDAEMALKQGDKEKSADLANRLMITQAELETVEARSTKTDNIFFSQLRSKLPIHPLVVIGWSVSEPYLKKVINDAMSEMLIPKTVEDLSIIDIEFNPEGHAKIVACYGLSREQTFFKVSKIGEGFDLDKLFLWLQAIYCLDQMIRVADASIVESLESVREKLSQPVITPFVFDWADKFLPAWTQLCWRGGVIECEGFKLHNLRVDKKDDYIPCRLPVGAIRFDLEAAARLLVALLENNDKWDLREFPGALWERSTKRLVLPLPAWGKINVLTGLKPMADRYSAKMGFVERVELLPLHPKIRTRDVSADIGETLSEGFQSVFAGPGSFDPAAIQAATDIDA